jgi:hypothetical protein
MPSPDEKDRASNASNDAKESGDEGRDRPGMPDEASVLSERNFTSPKGREYRIIETDEKDAYDAPPPPKEQDSERSDP